MEDKRWICKVCKAFIGFVSADGKMIRVKYKDLFIYFEGGRVKIICRKCGIENELVDEEYRRLLESKLSERR